MNKKEFDVALDIYVRRLGRVSRPDESFCKSIWNECKLAAQVPLADLPPPKTHRIRQRR